MTAKEYLNQLIEMDDTINKKQRRLETLRSVALNITPCYSKESVQRTREHDQFEKMMSKIIDLELEIDSDIDALVDLKAEVWEQLDEMENEIYKTVLWLRYAERKTWNSIAAAIHFTSRYIRMLHGQALNALDIVLKNK